MPRPRSGRAVHVPVAEALSRMESRVRWLIPLDDCRVLGCGELRWEGRGSGIKLEGTIYWSYWLRHGHLLRSRTT